MNPSARIPNLKFVKQILARAIVCSVLLVLPSCAIPNLRPAMPAPDLPESFRGVANTENSSQLQIEEFFDDSTLTGLIEQTIAGNRELQILNEEVQVAKSEVLARQGAYLPFVTLGANAGLEKNSFFTPLGAAENQLEYLPGKHFASPSPFVGGGLNVFWQLDIWRELRNARDAATQRYLAAKERRNYFVTRLVAENAEKYYELMALDRRLENLDLTIELQEQSLKIAQSRLEAARGTELAVQRFRAEVRKNQSDKLIVKQEIVQAENRINFLVNRFPQPVERMSAKFFDLKFQPLNIGVPSQLLTNRPDIRQAERELEATGLDIKVARAHFFPKVSITGGIGYQAFNPRYLFQPDALAYNAAGNLIQPLVNKKAIQAEFLSANAKQLEAMYNYQRIVLNAFTEVYNRVSMVENYSKSLDIKKQQIEALEASVESATKLFQGARVEYIEVLFAQRDLRDARMTLIDTKKQQLSAIVNTYQSLGGGAYLADSIPEPTQIDNRSHWFGRLWSHQ